MHEGGNGIKMNKTKIGILLGAVCMILTFATCIQLKTIAEANKTASGSFSENRLRDEVLRWKEKYDIVYAKVQEEEKKLEKIRKKVTENDESATTTREELKTANRLLGFTDLTGKGIEITLEDNKLQSVDGLTTGNIMDYVVHDDDLIQLINDIKNAGVDAIAINNQRIVSTTGIVCDGNVVRINGEKVSQPFVIKAIGSPEGIMGALTTLGASLDTLQRLGIVKEVKKSNSVNIPKYEGVIVIEHIRTLS